LFGGTSEFEQPIINLKEGNMLEEMHIKEDFDDIRGYHESPEA
jgi:hypothetical protein